MRDTGTHTSDHHPFLMGLGPGLLLVVFFLLRPLLVLAFTEPSTAPPGGAAAAPLNVSLTAQTKQGRLNVGMLTPANPAEDDIGLAIGSTGIRKFLCLNGEDIADTNLCIDSWTDIVGSGAVLTNPGPTPAYRARIPAADYDPGFVAIGARDYTQVWAIGGQAANLTGAPPGSTTVGVYGSSAEGTVAEPYDPNARSYGVLGVAQSYLQIGGPVGSVRTAGIVGITGNTSPASFFKSFSTGPAAMFQGSVGGGYDDPANIKSGFTFTRLVTPEPTSNSDDAISAYTTMPGSGVYVEQRNFASPSAYAGYFSGRLAAIGIVNPANATDGQDSVLKVQCKADGTNCLDVDLEKTEAFTWQTLRHTGDEKWRIGSNQTVGRGQFYFGLDARSSSGPIGAGNIFKILQTGEAALGSVSNVNPEPQLLVRRGVTDTNDGNPNDAVDIIANTTESALYVEQQNSDAGTWAAYFSGDVAVGSAADPKEFCLNDTCVTSISGGPGGSYWRQTAGNILSPLSLMNKVAIGGSTAAAPFYYDPEANIVSVTGGNLALKSGALTLKNAPSRNPEDPPEIGLFQPGETEMLFGRVASALTPAAALAGSVTNPGGAPPVRLLVRDGVISVENGPDKLELGNAGRDIASSGTLYLRPNGLDYTIAAQLSLDPATGQTRLRSPRGLFRVPGVPGGVNASVLEAYNDLGGPTNTAATALFVQNTAATSVAPALVATNSGNGDAIQGKAPLVSNSISAIYGENASATGWAGYFSGRVNVTSSLCFGGADCRNSWPTLAGLGGIGGSGSVNYVPKFTPNDTTLGISAIFDDGNGVGINNITPVARLVVNQGGAAGDGSSGDAIAAYALSTNAAIMGEQGNLSGWAGYFSGKVKVKDGLAAFDGGLQSGSSFELGTGQWTRYEGQNWNRQTPVGGTCTISQVAVASADDGQVMQIQACNTGTIYSTTVPISLGPGSYSMVARVRTFNGASPNTLLRMGMEDPATAVFDYVDIPEEQFRGRAWTTFTFHFEIDPDAFFHPSIPRFEVVGGNLVGADYFQIDWVMFIPEPNDRRTACVVARSVGTGTSPNTNMKVNLTDCSDGCTVDLLIRQGGVASSSAARLYLQGGFQYQLAGVEGQTSSSTRAVATTVHTGGTLSLGTNTDILMTGIDGGRQCWINWYDDATGGEYLRLRRVSTAVDTITCEAMVCD